MENGEIEDHYVRGKAPPSFVSSASENCFWHLTHLKYDQSGWGLYNGSATYDHLSIDQHKFSRKIVEDALKAGRKSVAFLDVGAGNFQSCDAWATYFNETFPQLDITIHIVGIRGEHYNGKEIENIGNCRVSKFGYFKLEDLENEFSRRNVDLKFDLTVSNWSFRHLVDPLRTLVQVFNRTSPQGFVLSDWFYYLYDGEEFDTKYDAFQTSRRHLLDFLRALKMPFLFYPKAEWSSKTVDCFLVQKSEDRSLELPLAYKDLRCCNGEFFDLAAAEVVRFKVMDPNYKAVKLQAQFESTSQTNLCGDLSLFQWLQTNGLTCQHTRLYEQFFIINGEEITPWRTPQEVLQAQLEADKKLKRQLALKEKISRTKTAFYASLKNQLKQFEIAPVAEGRSNMCRDIEWDLYSALRSGNFEGAQVLIDNGANANRYFDFGGRSCKNFLDFAAQGDFKKGSISFLLRNNAKTEYQGTLDNALYFYAPAEDIELLVKYGYQGDLDLSLFRAIAHGEKRLIDLFLSLGANVNSFINGHPMIYGSSGDKDIWNYLLGKGAKGHHGEDLPPR